MDYIIPGYSLSFLDLVSIIAIGSGLQVIIMNNPIVSVLFLIGLFLTVSGYLITLGFNYIGLSYLLVYVGAISILFIFILMLINIRISEIITKTANSVPLIITIGIIYIYTSQQALPQSSSSNFLLDFIFNFSNISPNDRGLNMDIVSGNYWEMLLTTSSYIISIGNILYATYPLWLILTSLILTLSMVGCILISMNQ